MSCHHITVKQQFCISGDDDDDPAVSSERKLENELALAAMEGNLTWLHVNGPTTTDLCADHTICVPIARQT